MFESSNRRAARHQPIHCAESRRADPRKVEGRVSVADRTCVVRHGCGGWKRVSRSSFRPEQLAEPRISCKQCEIDIDMQFDVVWKPPRECCSQVPECTVDITKYCRNAR